MASSVEITQDIASGSRSSSILCAHNPNILKFKVDTDGKTIEEVKLQVVWYNVPANIIQPFYLYGIETGVNEFTYRFDFMELFKIIATDNISDDEDLLNPIKIIPAEQNTLTHLIDYTITVKYTDTSEDEIYPEYAPMLKKKYLITNGVKQIPVISGAFRKLLEAFNSPVWCPCPDYSDADYVEEPFVTEMTFFKGYPFTIGFNLLASGSPQNIIVKDLTTLLQIQLTGIVYDDKDQLYRVLLGWGTGQALNFNDGLTTVEITSSITAYKKQISLNVVDKPVIYVKWLNSYGYWSYWGFNCAGLSTSDTKTDLIVNKTLDSFFSATGNYNVISKTKVSTLTVFDQHLTLKQKNFIEQIADSLNVYVWTKPQGTEFNAAYWKRVNVDKYKSSTKGTTVSHSVEIELTNPIQYSQTN